MSTQTTSNQAPTPTISTQGWIVLGTIIVLAILGGILKYWNFEYSFNSIKGITPNFHSKGRTIVFALMMIILAAGIAAANMQNSPTTKK